MSANVRHTSQLVIFISGKDQRLSQVAIEQNKRINAASCCNRLIITDPLPALQEYVLLNFLKYLVRMIKLGVDSRGLRDVWVNIEFVLHCCQSNRKFQSLIKFEIFDLAKPR